MIDTTPVRNALQETVYGIFDVMEEDIALTNNIQPDCAEKLKGHLRRARNQLDQMQLKFIESTKSIIAQAMSCSESEREKRVALYNSWKSTYEGLPKRYKQIIEPVRAVAEVLRTKNKEYEKKYKFVLGAGFVLFCANASLAGCLIAHAIPAAKCAFLICGVSAACTGIGAAIPWVLLGVAITAVIGVIYCVYKAYKLYKKSKKFSDIWIGLTDWIGAHAPSKLKIFQKGKDHGKKITDEMVDKACNELFSSFQMQEPDWYFNETLQIKLDQFNEIKEEIIETQNMEAEKYINSPGLINLSASFTSLR